MELLVEERDRRGVARAEALEGEQRELAVVGGLVRLDAEARADMVDELLVAADLAGDRLADADDALADGFCVELLVEGHGVHHIRGLDREERRDLDHRLVRDVAVLVLDLVEDRQERALLRRIAREDVLGPAVLHRGRAVGLGAGGDLGGGGWLGRPAHVGPNFASCCTRRSIRPTSTRGCCRSSGRSNFAAAAAAQTSPQQRPLIYLVQPQ